MRRVFKVMRQVIDSHDDVEIIYPVHLSPKVQQVANEVLGGDPRIHLIEPLDVVDFHNLAKRSYFIMKHMTRWLMPRIHMEMVMPAIES